MREWLQHPRDAWRYLCAPRKSLVLILCTMRSGSTLLKAVLGAAPDVSHLAEVPFHHLRTNSFAFYTRFCSLAPEPVIVLKHPAWFTDPFGAFAVPRVSRVRVIGLVRDCYPTLCSLKAMPAEGKPDDAALVDYWLRRTSQILDKTRDARGRGRVLRYEDLVADPIAVSAETLRFIGSRMREGVRHYAPPASGEWQWGSDDGGDKIRSRAVEPAAVHDIDPELLALIERNAAVTRLRARLGYSLDHAARAAAGA